MKPSEPITIDRSLIGIAAFQRNSWNLLLLQGTGERARVLSASSYASIGEVTEALHAAKGADLRIMHPTSATIVKVVRLPMVAASQMKQALKLQAEGMLLGATPACRVGLAPIPDVLGLDERQGLILVWPESAAGIVDRGIPSTAQFIPEPAALLPFITIDAPALIADRASGTVLLGLRGDNGMTLRSTRENTTDDAAWRASVRGSLLESLLNAGRDPATAAKEADRVLADAIETQDGFRGISRSAISAVCGMIDFDASIPVDDQKWWNTWALLVGAAIATQGEFAGLTELRREEERDAPTITDRLIQRYSNRRRSIKAAAAAVLLLGIAPVLFGWMRVSVLEWKLPSELSAFERQQRGVDRRVAIYKELANNGMPVAKMLGDLACCTADGIELVSIHLSKNQGLVLRGTARTQSDAAGSDIVARMVSQLRESKIFDAVTVSFAPPDARGIYVFTLNAEIEAPTVAANIPEDRDWAVKTFVERKWGKLSADETMEAPTTAPVAALPTNPTNPSTTPATAVTPAVAPPTAVVTAPDAPSAESSSTPTRGIGRRVETPPTEGATGGATGEPVTGPASTAVAIQLPAEFTDDELKAMSKEQARAVIGEIAMARKQPGLEPAVLERLNKDWKRLLEFLKSQS